MPTVLKNIQAEVLCATSAASFAPLCNTGGVSGGEGSRVASPTLFPTGSKTSIDTFSITTHSPIKRVHELIGSELQGVDIVPERGRLNYAYGAKLLLNGQVLGWTRWGGKEGRCLLYVDGAGCRHIAKAGFGQIAAAIAQLDAVRYTRVDIACDTFEGEAGSPVILAAHEAGGFSVGRAKKRPKRCVIESMCPNGKSLGTTIYIGSRNGKHACCYEKGLQLFGKDPATKISKSAIDRVLKSAHGQQLIATLGTDWNARLARWYRVEVRFLHNKRCPISLDILNRPDQYFAGAYPFCQNLLSHVDPDRLVYVHDEAHDVLHRQIAACRNSYGGLFRTLTDCGFAPAAIVGMLIAEKPSRRLREAGIQNVQSLLPLDRASMECSQ